MEIKNVSFTIAKEIPFDFNFNRSEDFAIENNQWHAQVEILYIFSGEIDITISGQTYQLKEDQIVIINPYEIHSIKGNKYFLGRFQIDLYTFAPELMEVNTEIDCNSATVSDEELLSPVKLQLLNIMKVFIETGKKDNELRIKSLIYSLLYEFHNNFVVNCEENKSRKNAQLQRMENIIRFLAQHYNEDISLKMLAEKFYLTVPYLSRMFKENVKMTFTEYLNNIRLSHALTYLQNPNLTLESIAGLCGFSSNRSFTTIFKRKYNMYPSEYRKNSSEVVISNTGQVTDEEAISRAFSKYLYRDFNYVQPQFPIKLTQVDKIDVMQKAVSLKHNYKKMIGIGKAKHLLYSDIQEIVAQTQKEIGFTYINFYGVLDDDLMIYDEDVNGNPRLNFQYIDTIVDFLLSIGLKPFLQLSFMPKALAETPERTMFYNPSIISFPNSMEKWCYLVTELTRHFQIRYTSEEVTTWPFSVWNEPETPEVTFGFDDEYRFFDFYRMTYEAVKACNREIKFGTPAFIDKTVEEVDWFLDFMEYCKKNNCEPDFLNYHFFSIKHPDKNISRDLISHTNSNYRESPDSFKESLDLILRNLKRNKLNFSKIYLSEWNSSLSHFELLNDTAFKAAYIVKNILENYDRIDSFSYWMLSDFNDELQMPESMFFGGLGLITSNGIKKSAFYAFSMLNGLGKNLVEKGDGYFITKTENTYQILCYNYIHFSAVYAKGEMQEMVEGDRYLPFENICKRKFVFPMINVPEVSYNITETILNRENGSSYDKWKDMGAVQLETQREIDYLKNISIPSMHKETVNAKDNLLTVSCVLEPHEVRLITIIPN